jgi:histidinol dehydrogenase
MTIQVTKKASKTPATGEGDTTKIVHEMLDAIEAGFEIELSPGLFAGQRLIPVKTAGCYVPGWRYSKTILFFRYINY